MASDPASQPLWLIILSSSAISTVILAALQGLYHLRSQRNEYVNDYYKTVITRRIAAYEELEKMITSRLRVTVVGPDDRPFSLLFVHEVKDPNQVQSPHLALLSVTSACGYWFSNELAAKLEELESLISSVGSDDLAAIEFGKKNYQAVEAIGTELQRLLARDILKLHDVKGFLQSKEKTDPRSHPVVLPK